MALANTILTAISTVAVLMTVWLAYLAFSKAKETLDEAKTATVAAEQAAKGAAVERVCPQKIGGTKRHSTGTRLRLTDVRKSTTASVGAWSALAR